MPSDTRPNDTRSNHTRLDDTSGRHPLVSILGVGPYLIASVNAALDDGQLTRFQHDLVEQIGRSQRHGVIIDLAAIDVLDSFATHTLRELVRMASLHGASTVIVGIRPDVAFAMVRLGMHSCIARTALDLDDGMAVLDKLGICSRIHRDTVTPPPAPITTDGP